MSTRTDEGFSLVEVVVAMFLFLIIATALVPLTVQAVSLSTVNRDLTAANTLAAARLAEMRDQFADESSSTACSAVRATAHTGLADPAGTGLTSNLIVSTCPASYPGTVTVTAQAIDGGRTLVTIPTRIVVTAP